MGFNRICFELLTAILAFTILSATTAYGSREKESATSIDYSAKINKKATRVKVDLPFSKGVNFSIWFEKDSPADIDFIFYTEQDFIDVKKMGVDVVRLPVRFHKMTAGSPTYKLDKDFLNMLDMAVGWAEKHGLFLILDNHSWSPTEATASDVGKILVPVWQQIATRYKGKNRFLVYEILNEPHGIDQKLWSRIQADVVAAIKAKDPDCRILVTGTKFGSIDGLKALPVYKYSNIIYSFHFYDPYLFTHQGQTWDPPFLDKLAGIPFPAGAHAMPKLPAELKGGYTKTQYDRYRKEGTISALEANLDAAVKFANDSNVPIFCGEFGVYIRNSLHKDRVRWYQTVSELLRIRNIAYTSWDYYGPFGLFDGWIGLAEYDMKTDIAKALSFIPPVQKKRKSVTSGFKIYDNAPITTAAGFTTWGSRINYYLKNGGNYVMKWGNIPHYGSLKMSFRHNVNFMSLKNNNYAVRLKVKATGAVNFRVRFTNSSINGQMPWRMEKRISADTAWRTMTFRLSDMAEAGAWLSTKNKFVKSTGNFRWDDISAMEFVAEDGAIKEDILFSMIEIIKQ